MKKEASETVACIRKNEFVAAELVNNKIDLNLFLSNDIDDDPAGEIWDVLWAWVSGEKSAEIWLHFNIASIVDCQIEVNSLLGDELLLDAASRPIFDAIRAEMAAEIARIDTLKYKDEGAA